MQDLIVDYHDFCRVYFKNIPRSIERFIKSRVPEFVINDPKEQNNPDIEVEFLDLISPASSMVYIGRDCGFDKEVLYVFDWAERAVRYKAELKIKEILDGRVKLKCEKDFNPLRFFEYLILPLIRMIALKKGFLFIHASSFVYKGQSYLFPAWGHTGKTGVLLFLAENGGEFLSDEWSIVNPSGELLPNPKKVRVDGFTLNSLPRLTRHLSPSEKIRLFIFRFVQKLDSRWGSTHEGFVHNSLVFLLRAATSLTQFNLPPDKFNRRKGSPVSLDNIVLLANGPVQSSSVQRITKDVLAGRISSSFFNEEGYLWVSSSMKNKHDFAFPGLREEFENYFSLYEEKIKTMINHVDSNKIRMLLIPERLGSRQFLEIQSLLEG